MENLEKALKLRKLISYEVVYLFGFRQIEVIETVSVLSQDSPFIMTRSGPVVCLFSFYADDIVTEN